MLMGTMPDLSIDPLSAAFSAAGLLLVLREQRRGSEESLDCPLTL
jgi:hypothetical protein